MFAHFRLSDLPEPGNQSVEPCGLFAENVGDAVTGAGAAVQPSA
jgi:hypothetical protein